MEAANIHSERTEIRSDVLLPTDSNTNATEESYPIIQDSDMKTLEEQLRMANTEIKRLRDEIQNLRKPFTTKTILLRKNTAYPIVATIDPLKKEISLQAKW